MQIWKTPNITLAALQNNSKNTLVEHIGIEFIEIGADYIKANVFQIKNLFMMQTFYTSCNFLDVWDVSVVISCIKGKYGSLIHYVSGRGIIMRI